MAKGELHYISDIYIYVNFAVS